MEHNQNKDQAVNKELIVMGNDPKKLGLLMNHVIKMNDLSITKNVDDVDELALILKQNKTYSAIILICNDAELLKQQCQKTHQLFPELPMMVFGENKMDELYFHQNGAYAFITSCSLIDIPNALNHTLCKDHFTNDSFYKTISASSIFTQEFINEDLWEELSGCEKKWCKILLEHPKMTMKELAGLASTSESNMEKRYRGIRKKLGSVKNKESLIKLLQQRSF